MITPALVRASLQGPLPLPPLGTLIDVSRARAAAVVVPIAFSPEPAVVVVLRGSHLADHAGEVGGAPGR